MPVPQLYFLSEQYYLDFPDDKLMKNKEMIGGVPHNRPYFFAFPDTKNADIYWIVPISSKYDKYKRIEQDKIQKYGHCNTIRFGTVLGKNAVFLIQNMCPATDKYLIAYIDKNNCPIRIDNRIAADVVKNARSVLAIARRGSKVIFPDIFRIYSELEQQLKKEHDNILAESKVEKYSEKHIQKTSPLSCQIIKKTAETISEKHQEQQKKNITKSKNPHEIE